MHAACSSFPLSPIFACAGSRKQTTGLLDEISFNAPQHGAGDVTIDAAAVNAKLAELARDQDLSRYIL